MKAQKVFSLTLLTFALAACGSGGGGGGGVPTHLFNNQQRKLLNQQRKLLNQQRKLPNQQHQKQNQPNQRKKSRKIPLRDIIMMASLGLQAMSLAMISIPFACGEPIFS